MEYEKSFIFKNSRHQPCLKFQLLDFIPLENRTPPYQPVAEVQRKRLVHVLRETEIIGCNSTGRSRPLICERSEPVPNHIFV